MSDNPILEKAAVALLSLVLLVLGGTAGFHFVEGWGWWDSFFMVVISITTVGYGEVHPLSLPGQVLSVFVIVGGMGVGSYVLVMLTRHLFEGAIEGSIQRAVHDRRLDRRVGRMRDHIIVCGFGRLGREICAALAAEGRGIVVIESEPEAAARARHEGYPTLEGDASEEEVLRRAGIEQAQSVAVATRSDAMNTWIVLAARELNPKLRILARASDDAAARRLRRSGADQLVSPAHLGGRRMASMLLRPAVVDFLDLAELGDHPDLFIEELRMEPTSHLCGQTLREAAYSNRWNVLVLAVRDGDGRMAFRPNPDQPLSGGDTLIVAGHRQDLGRLEQALREAAA